MVNFETVAERVLARPSAESDMALLRVSIGRPYLDDGGDYVCPFMIVSGETSTIRRAAGIDGIQAMQLALVMIGAELAARREQLTWNGSQSLGFPKSTTDAVVGF